MLLSKNSEQIKTSIEQQIDTRPDKKQINTVISQNRVTHDKNEWEQLKLTESREKER